MTFREAIAHFVKLSIFDQEEADEIYGLIDIGELVIDGPDHFDITVTKENLRIVQRGNAGRFISGLTDYEYDIILYLRKALHFWHTTKPRTYEQYKAGFGRQYQGGDLDLYMVQSQKRLYGELREYKTAADVSEEDISRSVSNTTHTYRKILGDLKEKYEYGYFNANDVERYNRAVHKLNRYKNELTDERKVAEHQKETLRQNVELAWERWNEEYFKIISSLCKHNTANEFWGLAGRYHDKVKQLMRSHTALASEYERLNHCRELYWESITKVAIKDLELKLISTTLDEYETFRPCAKVIKRPRFSIDDVAPYIDDCMDFWSHSDPVIPDKSSGWIRCSRM